MSNQTSAQDQSVGTIRFLRSAARLVLVIITLFWFIFAAVSGAKEGFAGFMANLPNTLPWLGLLSVVYIAFRWELVGGVLVLAAGVASAFFFNAWTAPVVLLGISVPLMAAGASLIACHYLECP